MHCLHSFSRLGSCRSYSKARRHNNLSWTLVSHRGPSWDRYCFYAKSMTNLPVYAKWNHCVTSKFHVSCLCSRLPNCCGEWQGWDPVNRFNYTSWVAIVTQTDHPKSVRNRCVIRVLVFFVLSCCVLDLFVDVGAIVIWLSQVSSFFSHYEIIQPFNMTCKIRKIVQNLGNEIHCDIMLYSQHSLYKQTLLKPRQYHP